MKRIGAGLVILMLSGASAIANEAIAAAGPETTPNIVWILPFVAILLSIALFPLVGKLSHWWEHNYNKLLVSIVLAFMVCGYYLMRGYGFAGAEPGMFSVLRVLDHAILADYIPFIVLLFSLYTISGGIRLSGDIPAHPPTNTFFLFIGAMLASFIGTTGASMLLIRPLLQINSERRNIMHTVIFFIFLVSNIGGALLPVGDPPLFLGYLRGVPFLWTLHLVPIWLVTVGIVLATYYVFDLAAYRHEGPRAIRLDETRREPIRLSGKRNFILLAGVVLAVALLVPGRTLPVLNWTVPDIYLREFVQLALAGISMLWTDKHIRHRRSGGAFHRHLHHHAGADRDSENQRGDSRRNPSDRVLLGKRRIVELPG
jgi:Na+/H+ antiporter NhaD/arsenite permease-like protein